MAHLDVTVQVLVDVQRLEESLVQPATLLIVTTPVERLGVFKESQACLDDLPGQAEILIGVGKPFRKALALPGDLVQSCADLALGESAVGG
ncbi:hypothetical protein [Streptomyces griseorubiginosus]|uniref:hypothetical protein n=1 Tax=Streptomyces griseorubiginosus TaxID=67304 RepID=UPI002E800207|nr:hypothetical protein [Streptomyces griseorubiginosus]WUB46437.1 hypothetical protein OHN19_25130 [Streptomyces griseorubiginosus]WUB54958.1 hypothetical protein OG942_25135 [Streptomyces griseorubiginosus]